VRGTAFGQLSFDSLRYCPCRLSSIPSIDHKH